VHQTSFHDRVSRPMVLAPALVAGRALPARGLRRWRGGGHRFGAWRMVAFHGEVSP